MLTGLLGNGGGSGGSRGGTRMPNGLGKAEPKSSPGYCETEWDESEAKLRAMKGDEYSFAQ